MDESEYLQKLNEMNMLIGLASPNGNNYKERLHKHQQMQDYYVAVKSVMKNLSTKRQLYLYDCGCGRSYISFFLNFSLKNDNFNNVSFLCVDSNKKLIERCREAADELKIDNMEFKSSSIIDCDFPHRPDIVYSLHACDIATDQMIYKGISSDARNILSVSCCQHTTRGQMKKHPLSAVTRHQPYKERLTDMVSDSLRTLILEAFGYKVCVYEFVASAYTPKNVMLKCEKINRIEEKTENAMREYIKLASIFNVHPMLETYLQDELMNISETYREYKKNEPI